MIRAASIVMAGLSLSLALAGIAAVRTAQQSAPADGWITFSGTWSASGHRQTIPIEGGGAAAIIGLSGAIVFAPGSGLEGFLGEAIGLDDGRALSIGRATWTDRRGDRIFSDVKGEPMGAGRRVHGTITGGSGRYADAAGEYELTWQYVARGDGDEVQGRTVDLKGRLR